MSQRSSPASLVDLDDDTLIIIYGFLPVPSILSLRKTCERLNALSRLPTIWHTAYNVHVLAAGIPFPSARLRHLATLQLELHVQHALRLGDFWLGRARGPRRLAEWQGSRGTSVSEVAFLPGRGDRYVVTVSKGIWSEVKCWRIPSVLPGGAASEGCDEAGGARLIGEWCPKGTIFTGFVVNDDPESEAALAVSVEQGGNQSIKILRLTASEERGKCLEVLGTVHTLHRVVALHGDLIAFSNDSSDTTIMNWRTGCAALLCSRVHPVDLNFQYNRCLQVVYLPTSMLVVRARSLELFSLPALHPPNHLSLSNHPIASHSFGWIDGVSVSLQAGVEGTEVPPLSILLRAESDDPWAGDAHSLNLYVLEPNPLYDPSAGSSFPLSSPPSTSTATETSTNGDHAPAPAPPAAAPYLFPPRLTLLSSPTIHGFLRCTGVVLGRSGTAVWVQPRPARTADLTAFDVHANATQGPALSAVGGGAFSASASGSALPTWGAETEVGELMRRLDRGDVGAPERPRESIVGAVFAGRLQRANAGVGLGTRTIWSEEGEARNWTAVDYDEVLGRVCVGSVEGRVTVLSLA